MGNVLKALQRNESVTLLRRGKPIAVIRPLAGPPARRAVADHEAFGMWKERADLRDVEAAVDTLRKGRVDAL